MLPCKFPAALFGLALTRAAPWSPAAATPVKSVVIVHGALAADLPPADAAFLAHSQVFAAKSAFTTPAGDPAWKSKPSWALVATADRSINPELELEMARQAGSHVRSVEASHAVYAAKPEAVAALIVEAAEAVSK